MSELQHRAQNEREHLPPPLTTEKSPFWPQNLVDLYIRPTRFFSQHLALGKTPYALFVAWIVGIGMTIDRIDQRLMQVDLGRDSVTAFVEIAESWLAFWGVALGFGMISGILVWYLGGWWCKVRLRWSGAEDPDPQSARLLLIYSSFVFAAPHVLVVLLQTQMYEDYLDAYNNDVVLSLIPLAMLFWSIATTYKGALAMFSVQRWKASIWFIILPMLFYLVLGGVLGVLFATVA
jgi:hypothetical protein